MRALRTISKVLFVFPALTLIYDLVNEWFVEARFNIRTLKEWVLWLFPDWVDPLGQFLQKVFGASNGEAIMDTMAPVVLVIPPIVLYAIYRLWFAAKGGHGAGRIIFRSHD